MDAFIANAVFYEIVLILKGYSVISVFFGSTHIFKSAHYNCQFTSLDFHDIPGGFRCLPAGKFIPTSHPGKFVKICQLPR